MSPARLEPEWGEEGGTTHSRITSTTYRHTPPSTPHLPARSPAAGAGLQITRTLDRLASDGLRTESCGQLSRVHCSSSVHTTGRQVSPCLCSVSAAASHQLYRHLSWLEFPAKTAAASQPRVFGNKKCASQQINSRTEFLLLYIYCVLDY